VARVYGVVTDADTKRGLEGVPLKFDSHVAVTEEDGSYELEIPAGTYTLRVRTELRRPITRTVTVTEPETEINLVLEKAVPI